MAPGFQDPDCTVFISNVEARVTEEHLWELFLQAGPLRNVHIPTDKATGKNRTFAFITFRDECSVPYACELFNKLFLYKKPIYCKPTKDGKQANSIPPLSSASPQVTVPERPNQSSNHQLTSYSSLNNPSVSPQLGSENSNFRPMDQNNRRSYNADRRDRSNDYNRTYESPDRNGDQMSHNTTGGYNSYNDRESRGRYGNSSRHENEYRYNESRYDHRRNMSPNSPNVNNISPFFLEAVNQSINQLRRQGSQGYSPLNNQSQFGPVRQDSSRHRDIRRNRSHPY